MKGEKKKLKSNNITIGTCPKEFNEEFKLIQENSISSWKQITNNIILLGKESSEYAEANKLQWYSIVYASYIPLIDSAFKTLQLFCKTDYFIFINTDIILIEKVNLSQVLSDIRNKIGNNFIGIGDRIEIYYKERYDKSSLLNKVEKSGVNSGIYAIDYFILPKDLSFDFPKLYMGRPGWDNFVIEYFKKNKIPIIDFSNVFHAVHQDHSFTSKGGFLKAWNEKEAKENRSNLKSGKVYSLNDANFIYNPENQSLQEMYSTIETSSIPRMYCHGNEILEKTLINTNKVNRFFNVKNFTQNRMNLIKDCHQEGKYIEALDHWIYLTCRNPERQFLAPEDFNLIKYCREKAIDNCKLKILLVYGLRKKDGKITFPEWIKEAFRLYYKDQVEIFAAGPRNEINIPDTPDFYNKIAQLIKDLNINVLIDIEGGFEDMNFVFKRVPQNINILKIFWAIDTHQYLNFQSEKAKYFDLVFSAQKNALDELGENSFWIPSGASIYDVNYKENRSWDILFIGHIFPGLHTKRKQIIQKLKETYQGNFGCFENIFNPEKSYNMSRAKIGINVSLNNDINFRVFETMASGAMLITNEIIDNGLEDIFTDGEHLVTFKDEEDLIEKINYYLSHSRERNRIAKAGQKRVQEYYTHKVICGKVINIVKNFLANRRLKCWCGGLLNNSVHDFYGECEICHTLVTKNKYSSLDLQNYYSFNHYWHAHQTDLNFPVIEDRIENDLHDRIPQWYQILKIYCKNINSLLEIGCAHGAFLDYCRQQGIKKVVGVEVDPSTCEFVKNQFNIEVCSGLFPDVELPLKKFDIITGFDVLEHFQNPIETLESIRAILKNKGILIIQTPDYKGENETWQQFKPEEHLFLYNKDSIVKLFINSGFKIIDILSGIFPDDMIIIGEKI